MGRIELVTLIDAPLDCCFDLSRSVDLHVKSASGTTENAVAGVTKGLLGDQDVVTWQARHFGVVQRLTSKIVAYDRPNYFRDSQIQGIFKRFDHDHIFEPSRNGTKMKDILDFTCPLGVFGLLADFFVKQHLENFLKLRNLEIKRVAESDEWKKFL